MIRMTPAILSEMSGLCPLCGEVPHQWIFKKKRRDFYRCKSCGLERQMPLPTPQELNAYYDLQFGGGMYHTFTAAVEMKAMTARQRLKEIAPVIKTEGRWLDVGCADGVFVREAAALGVMAEGVELSSVAVGLAVAAGLPVRCGALEEVISAEPVFDCITAFDVLEHVLDPLAFLQGIAQRLKPGGHAALTMPDKSSLYARLMGPRWWFYIPEEHLHYFDRETIQKLMVKAGLEPVLVGRTHKPLTYDYGITQFIEFNPLIYRVMKVAAALIPAAMRRLIVPLYIGELKVIARKPSA